MTNKEKLQLIIENDFDKTKNYNQIIKKNKLKIKINNFVKLQLVPVCTLIIICGVLIFPNINKKDKVIYINDLSALAQTRANTDIYIEEETINKKSNKIHFNNNEMNKYTFLNKLNITNDYDSITLYKIYTKKDIDSTYNILNNYVLNFSDDKVKNIEIAFSENNKPIKNYSLTGGKNISRIGEVELKIYKCDEVYLTEFQHHNVYFNIKTTNISQEELIDLLTTIIK